MPHSFPLPKDKELSWVTKKKSFEEEQNNLNDIPKFQVLLLQENKMPKTLLVQMQTARFSK